VGRNLREGYVMNRLIEGGRGFGRARERDSKNIQKKNQSNKEVK
jgi:hypothetical protein